MFDPFLPSSFSSLLTMYLCIVICGVLRWVSVCTSVRVSVSCLHVRTFVCYVCLSVCLSCKSCALHHVTEGMRMRENEREGERAKGR